MHIHQWITGGEGCKPSCLFADAGHVYSLHAWCSCIFISGSQEEEVVSRVVCLLVQVTCILCMRGAHAYSLVVCLLMQVMCILCMRGAHACSSVDRRIKLLVCGTFELRPPSTSFQAHLQVCRAVCSRHRLDLVLVVCSGDFVV